MLSTAIMHVPDKTGTLKIKSRYNAFSKTIKCLVVEFTVKSMPLSHFQVLVNIKLANSNFHISALIDILLSAELFWKLLLE